MTELLRYAAFTDPDHPGGGNPAGVVLDASALDSAGMLALAAEAGFSESAFVVGTGPRRTVRYFSPLAEVAFCGHATIATAVALAEREGAGTLVLETLAGPVEVSTALGAHGATATLTSPPAGTRPITDAELGPLLTAFGWGEADLDPAYPVHVANAGNDHPVLALRERATLRAMDYDFPALAALMDRHGWTTVHCVWAEAPDVFVARDPFPPGGVREDPATGAAAAAFGGYLRDLGLLAGPFTVRQGEDLGRPSLLHVEPLTDGPEVRVTGTGAQLP